MSTYTPIASITLSASTSSVTFSNIPQTYTDLVLTVSGSYSGTTYGYFRFNDDSGSNYSYTRMLGYSGGTLIDYSGVNDAFSLGSNNGHCVAHINNYSNSTTYKNMLLRENQAGSATAAYIYLWRSTSAITSISLYGAGGNNFTSSTKFNLYGINAQASAQAKATGGSSIYTDGIYWYHTFYSSGTFTPTQNLSNVDYLVVAGGASGGGYAGGGGGAGGVRCTVGATGGGGSVESKLSLSATSYTVTVGAGGTLVSSLSGTNGSNSTFSTITATGGGGGGGNGFNGNGVSGGSGGGASGSFSSGTGTGGTKTNNQGYDGGSTSGGSGSDPSGGAGGGGAGAVGSNASGANRTGGAGGNGISTSISGSSITYGGGGGGAGEGSGSAGAGGAGGGGAGGKNIGGNATNGTANTGGGGGGVWYAATSQGGSGIVIIRYSAA